MQVVFLPRVQMCFQSVIDETVRELARRTGAEVVILDSVQLAAGEWGHFGKGEDLDCIPSIPDTDCTRQLPTHSNYPATLCTSHQLIPQLLLYLHDKVGMRKRNRTCRR
jgi:hypothetical protein